MGPRFGYVVVVVVSAMLAACSSTKVVEQWKDPAFGARFSDVLVLSLNGDDTQRRLFETGFTSALDKRNVESVASYELLPDKNDLDEENIRRAIAGSSIDAVLVMRQVKVKTQERYVPPRVDYVGDPFYGSFYGYYGHFAPIYTPGYITEDTIVHLESNLYAVEGEKLVWSGKTETFNPKNTNALIDELAKTILNELSKAKLI